MFYLSVNISCTKTNQVYIINNNNHSCRDTGSSDINKLATPDDDSDYFHGDFAQTVGSSQNKPESSVSSQVSESNQACGIVTTRPSPLIANGQDTRPGNLGILFIWYY